MTTKEVVELRCKKCNRKLLMATKGDGAVYIVCPRCKTYNTFKGVS